MTVDISLLVSTELMRAEKNFEPKKAVMIPLINRCKSMGPASKPEITKTTRKLQLFLECDSPPKRRYSCPGRTRRSHRRTHRRFAMEWLKIILHFTEAPIHDRRTSAFY